jgi:hypothetical protein
VASYDVVLTTYNIVQVECSGRYNKTEILSAIKWRRIGEDELTA